MKKFFAFCLTGTALIAVLLSSLSCVDNSIGLKGYIIRFTEGGMMLPTEDLTNSEELVADGGAIISIFGKRENGQEVTVENYQVILEYNLEFDGFEPVKVNFSREDGVTKSSVSYKDRVTNCENRGLAEAAAEVLGKDGLTMAEEAIRLGAYPPESDPKVCLNTLLSLAPTGSQEAGPRIAPSAKEIGGSFWLDVPMGPLVSSVCLSGSVELTSEDQNKTDFFSICLKRDSASIVIEDEKEGEVVIPLPLKVEVSSEKVEVNIGQRAEFRAIASGGIPPYTYEWQKKNGEGYEKVSVTSETLIFEKAKPEDTGQYQCIVQDSSDQTRVKSFTL